MKVEEQENRVAAPRPAPSRRVRSNGGETQKYFASIEFIFEYILKTQNTEQTGFYIHNLIDRLQAAGVKVPPIVSTPYLNTIPVEQQPEYPGNLEIERRIKSY